MIVAYCDASTIGDNNSATTILIKNQKFLGAQTKKYKNLKPANAELMALIQTLELSKEVDPKEKYLKVFTDCSAIISKYRRLRNNPHLKDYGEYHDEWATILRLIEKRNITISHIRGHQQNLNPNKVCDLLSKYCAKRGI